MTEKGTDSSTFRRAMTLRDGGAFERAVELFESLLTEDTDGQTRVAAYVQLGSIYTFELDLPAKGEHYFRSATELVPSFDIASLGLFMSLAKQGRDMEALDELKRYTSSYSSPEYAQLLREMKVKFRWFN